MKQNPKRGQVPRFNSIADAWLNGIERVELKDFKQARRSSMTEELKKAAEQSLSVCCVLHHKGQINELYKTLVGRIPSMKEHGRQFVRMIVVFDEDVIELSWNDLQNNQTLMDKLTTLIK